MNEVIDRLKKVRKGAMFIIEAPSGTGKGTVAKEILKQNALEWCQVQLSYAIGIAEPLAIYIESNKGSHIINKDSKYYEECKPQNIIRDLNLKDICYEERARYGHFLN